MKLFFKSMEVLSRTIMRDIRITMFEGHILRNLLIIKLRHSEEAFLLPGRLMINVEFRIPAVNRDNIAMGVILSDFDIIQCTNPGVSLSNIDLVASGVTSRLANPVPPVVKIRSSLQSSDQRIISCLISSISSGTQLV